MPVITISLLEGRADDLKEELIGNVTDTVADTLAIERDQVTVILSEMDKRHYAVGGSSVHKQQESN